MSVGFGPETNPPDLWYSKSERWGEMGTGCRKKGKGVRGVRRS